MNWILREARPQRKVIGLLAERGTNQVAIFGCSPSIYMFIPVNLSRSHTILHTYSLSHHLFPCFLCNFRLSGSCRICGRLPKPPREVGHHSFEMVLYFSNVKQLYIFFKMDILAKRMKMLYHLIFASLEHMLKIIQIWMHSIMNIISRLKLLHFFW